MRDATTLLFGLDGFRVVLVEVHDEAGAGALHGDRHAAVAALFSMMRRS